MKKTVLLLLLTLLISCKSIDNKNPNIVLFFVDDLGWTDLSFMGSKYYETPSWPNPKNPKFINIVLKIKCQIKPYELLSICKSIEVKLGRKKAAKNSPRVCDIDIIDFNGLILNDKLNLPHKMMHKRSFVLFPLFEIEKNWVHPIKKTNIKKLIFSLSNEDIRSIKQI